MIAGNVKYYQTECEYKQKLISPFFLLFSSAKSALEHCFVFFNLQCLQLCRSIMHIVIKKAYCTSYLCAICLFTYLQCTIRQALVLITCCCVVLTLMLTYSLVTECSRPISCYLSVVLLTAVTLQHYDTLSLVCVFFCVSVCGLHFLYRHH